MSTTHTKADFAKKLAEEIEQVMKQKYGIHVDASHSSVLKTNGPLDAINVRFPDGQGKNIAPTLYIEDAFNRFNEGKPIREIAKSMAEAAIEAHKHNPELPDLTPEEARRHITLTLVNTERNEQLLAKTPHFEIGDLSAIPRWYINDNASFVVNNDIAASLMMTPDEVLSIGQQNINSQQFEIKPMQEILRDMFAAEGMDPEMMDMMMPPEMDGPQMIVMTSQSHIQGANVLLSEESLDHVHEMLGDFIILPSSTHEVIAIPADDRMSPEELRNMVHEVNVTQVGPQDFLSDNIMKYDGQKLSLVRDDLKMDTPKVDGPKLDERTVHYAGMAM
jgi:hypothetical protein